MEKEPENTKKLDLRGERCPYTFIHSKPLIEKLKKGQILEVLIDNPTAIETIGQYAYKHNLKFEFERIDNYIRLIIKN